MRRFALCFVLAAPLLVSAAPRPAAAQIPDTFTNLQVLPEDIGRDSLIAIMRSFSFATGLRCEGCHVQRDDGSFVFDLDEKERKHTARAMLRMVGRINDDLLADLPGRDDRSAMRVECKTCHRGLSRPFLLRTELRAVIEEEGARAAVEHYRALREQRMVLGAYDFREWEMNELARQLAADGMLEEAVAMLVLNEEFHPTSGAIPLELGRLHERLGDEAAAIAAYRRVLDRNPTNHAAQARLQALTGG